MNLYDFMMRFRTTPKREADKRLWSNNIERELTAYVVIHSCDVAELYIIMFTDKKGNEQAFMNGVRIPVSEAIEAIRSTES